MTTNAERKFVNLRKRLDQLGYRQPLGIESLPLVEKLFSDLVHTTESLRNAKLSSGKTDRDGGSLETVLEPYRSENARLVRENNQLHLGLLALREEKDQLCLELKASNRKLEQETTDLKFLNNQYIFKVRALEQEGRAKTERIQQLQEKNLQAVVQTPGGKKRAIPFRRQRMQIDELVPPSTSCQLTMPPPDDPYVADLLQVADDRIQELQQDVARLKQELERTQGGIKHLNTQVEDRDREIERLGRALDGGRPHDVISLEARTISNEKLIAHLNLQVEYLQETNGDLKLQLQQLQEHKQSASSQVADLSAKNQELCQELSHIDHLAQQMERDKELVLETADQELLDAKKEIQRQHSAIEDLEDVITRLKRERAESDYEKDQLRNKLTEMGEQGEKMEGLMNFLEEEKMRLREKVEKMTDTEKDLVVELEKMRSQYGVCGKDHSPSRLDIFIRSLEEERDFYRLEVERLGKSRAGGGAGRSPARGRSPSQGGLHNRGHSCELELVRAVKERDELQATLQGFEKHMEDIQANVKLLTAERDKLSSHLQQVQKELVQVQEVAKYSPGLQERFDAELQRMAAERDALRERLKIIQTDNNTEREEEDGRILSLESTIQTLKREKSDLWCQVSALRESRVAVEAELMAQAAALTQTAEEAAQQRAEASALRLLQEQMEHTVSDSQHQLSVKINELHAAHKQIDKLEEKIADLNRLSSSCGDEVTILQKTVLALDREKDTLQETVDQKTEIIEALEEDVANKEKTLVNVKITINDMENSLQNLQGALGSREREISSLRRQLDVAQQELASISRELEIALRENRRLQDDLATMTRENQTVHAEMDEIMREKEELKMRVHSYIAEVARIESVIAIKERENRDILEHFRAAHAQADDWELKVQQAEGLNNSIRLELLSADTERRHLRERLVNLDQEIQEHMSAQQAYELQVSSLAKSMSLLEEELQRTGREKDSAHADLLAVRELCVKLDSSKERVSRQLTSKSMELERVLGELEDVRSETELLKNQLSSERLAVKNLETLLSSNRQKEFQTHLSASEKECELKVLRDRLALADSKTAGQTREVSQLRGKVSQLQTELDVLRRQLTTERFERERAVQEMRRQGVSFSSLRSSSPQNSSLSPRPLSPEHSDLHPPERSTGTTSDKSVSFKE